MTKQEIKTFISNDRLDEAISILLKVTEQDANSHLHSQVIAISAKFHSHKKRDIVGLLSHQEGGQDTSKIVAGLLYIVDEIWKNGDVEVPIAGQVPKVERYSKSPYLRYVLAGTIPLLVTLGLLSYPKTPIKTIATPPPIATGGITYGDVITIQHTETSRRLHSHPYNYGHPQSSGQQQITAYDGTIDENDYWKIKEAHATANRNQTPVQDNDIIRLEHINTGKNLHSHSHKFVPSPVTQQYEVTGFGTNGVGNSDDNWRIEIDGGGTWEKGKKIRIKHENTGAWLHSHIGKFDATWTRGQQEVTAYPHNNDSNNFWSLLSKK